MNFTVLQVCRFNTYLTNRYAIYRGKQWTEVDDEDDEDYYPELPILEWTMVEMTELGVFFVIACATAVMLFEYYDLYYSPTAVTDDGSLYRSLWDILYTIPVAIILLVVTTVSYKYYFKRYASPVIGSVHPFVPLHWTYSPLSPSLVQELTQIRVLIESAQLAVLAYRRHCLQGGSSHTFLCSQWTALLLRHSNLLYQVTLLVQYLTDNGRLCARPLDDLQQVQSTAQFLW